MSLYSTLLTLHSWLRWLVILAGLWAVFSAAAARSSRRTDRPGGLFTVGLDVQLVLGVLLYVAFSPITRAALTDMGAAMRDGTLRFWTAEHPALMILAVVFGHLGRLAVQAERPYREGVAIAAALVRAGAPGDPGGHALAVPRRRPAAAPVVGSGRGGPGARPLVHQLECTRYASTIMRLRSPAALTTLSRLSIVETSSTCSVTNQRRKSWAA